MTDDEKLASLSARYEAAGHRVQTGIALLVEHGSSMATPKHLRVGVDLRASDTKGLAQLLMDKGVFTKLEYIEAVTVAAEQEAEDYQSRVSAIFGKPVTLG